MSLSLREINIENFNESIKLKVAKDQKKFVATNSESIALSKVAPHLKPLTIYWNEEPVGFTLFGKDPSSKKYYIVRLMIDEKFQRKGFGKRATLKVIEKLSESEDCDEVRLFFVKGNIGAEKLYSNIGFKRTGIVDADGEIEMKIDLKSEPLP